MTATPRGGVAVGGCVDTTIFEIRFAVAVASGSPNGASALASSPTFDHRASCCFSRQRSTIARSPAGTVSGSGGGGSLITLMHSAGSESPLHGMVDDSAW
jgi:hypothetical protein